jgi:hypothetical protein
MTPYKLGTTLIFKRLSQAALAAELWGEDCLVPLIEGNIGHYKAYSEFYPPVKQSEMWNADAWQLTLDTPEKQEWFTPQVGDKWESEDLTVTITSIEADRVESCYGRVGAPSEDKAWCFATFFEIFTCKQRNGIAFPQPCEVIEP